LSLLLGLLACGGAAPEPTPEPVHVHEDGSKHVHEDAAAAGHTHADHMAVMAATRDRLRTELGDAYAAPVPGLEGADVGKGKTIYAANCASCHGEAGKGDGEAGKALTPPPADFTDKFHARYYSDAGRVQIIRKGSPGTAMVGWEGTLSAQDILDVYAYVRAFRE
jgi:high-affinity iron transporter